MHLHLRFRRIVALVAGLLLTLSIHAQVITKSFRGVPLKTVLEEVEKQTGYSFLFESKEVDVDKPVTASFNLFNYINVSPSFNYTGPGRVRPWRRTLR